MTKLYLPTDIFHQTPDHMKWGEGITNGLPKCDKPEVDSSKLIHAFEDINLLYLMSPACWYGIEDSIVWKARGTPVIKGDWSVGCFSLTTIRPVRRPHWVRSVNDWMVRLKFAILCADIVLPIYREAYPADDRPQQAIALAKQHLRSFGACMHEPGCLGLCDMGDAREAAEAASMSAADVWDAFHFRDDKMAVWMAADTAQGAIKTAMACVMGADIHFEAAATAAASTSAVRNSAGIKMNGSSRKSVGHFIFP